MTERISAGMLVSVTYTLHNERGEVYEQSNVPVSYLHGLDSGLFEKVEKNLEGRSPGEVVEVTLSPAEGFGDHNPALTFTDDIENVPPNLRFPGAQLEAQNANGEILNFVVTHIENSKLTVDANHPLAGQTVRFSVTVVGVRAATEEELHANPTGPRHTLQ